MEIRIYANDKSLFCSSTALRYSVVDLLVIISPDMVMPAALVCLSTIIQRPQSRSETFMSLLRVKSLCEDKDLK